MGWLNKLTKKESLPSPVHQLLVQSFGQVRKDVQNVYDWLKFLYNQNTFQQQLLEDQRKMIEDMRAQMALMPQNKEEVRALIDAHYDLEPVVARMQVMERRVERIAEQKVSVPIDEVSNQVAAKLNEVVSSHFDRERHALRQGLREEIHERIEEMEERVERSIPQDRSGERIAVIDERLASVTERLETLSRRQQELEQRPQQVVQAPQPVYQAPAAQPARSSQLKEKLMRSLTRNSKDYIKGTILNLIKKYQKITGLQLREMVVEEQGLVSRSSFYRLLGELENEVPGLSVIQHGKEKIYVLQESTIEREQQ